MEGEGVESEQQALVAERRGAHAALAHLVHIAGGGERALAIAVRLVDEAQADASREEKHGGRAAPLLYILTTRGGEQRTKKRTKNRAQAALVVEAGGRLCVMSRLYSA